VLGFLFVMSLSLMSMIFNSLVASDSLSVDSGSHYT
jgi:hypothetical protein